MLKMIIQKQKHSLFLPIQNSTSSLILKEVNSGTDKLNHITYRESNKEKRFVSKAKTHGTSATNGRKALVEETFTRLLSNDSMY